MQYSKLPKTWNWGLVVSALCSFGAFVLMLFCAIRDMETRDGDTRSAKAAGLNLAGAVFSLVAFLFLFCSSDKSAFGLPEDWRPLACFDGPPPAPVLVPRPSA